MSEAPDGWREPVPRWRRLPDGARLHARHGPIDLVVSVDGDDDVRRRCERAAHAALASVLTTLVAELGELRRVPALGSRRLDGPVARRMRAAVAPHRAGALTPMAAVAGAVADHVLAAMLAAGTPTRAFVDNGGDVALHVAPGERLRVGVRGGERVGADDGPTCACVVVDAGSGIGGVATSGRGGRSHSLGIADAVTVLARTAAAADAAATLVANACDLPGSAAVTRVPARELSPDSDLGERLVTVDVAALGRRERERALAPAVALARRLVGEGLIAGARLELQSDVAFVDAASRASFATGERACATRLA